MTREAVTQLLHDVLMLSTADETFLSLSTIDSTRMPFAAGRILPAASTRNAVLSITLRTGSHYASAVTNDLDRTSLLRLLSDTMERARILPESEHTVPFSSAVTCPEAPLFVRSNSDVPSSWRIDAARTVHDAAAAKGVLANGSITTSDGMTALASSRGLMLMQPVSSAWMDLRVYSKDGASTASAEARALDHAKLDVAGACARAIETCLSWQNPVKIKPERLTTVFDPSAVADILLLFIRQFDEQAVLEERSFIRKLDGTSRVGQDMFGPGVTLSSDPYDAAIPAVPFTADGLPLSAQTWVKDGVIEAIARSRYLAQVSGKDVLASPANLAMNGGSDSIDALIAGTKRGLYVRGFSSLQVEDPANCLITAPTRDGLFLIEDGRITRPVQNLVMRETPVYMFKRIEARSRQQVAWPRGVNFPMNVPALRVTDVMYTQLSGMV